MPILTTDDLPFEATVSNLQELERMLSLLPPPLSAELTHESLRTALDKIPPRRARSNLPPLPPNRSPTPDELETLNRAFDEAMHRHALRKLDPSAPPPNLSVLPPSDDQIRNASLEVRERSLDAIQAENRLRRANANLQELLARRALTRNNPHSSLWELVAVAPPEWVQPLLPRIQMETCLCAPTRADGSTPPLMIGL